MLSLKKNLETEMNDSRISREEMFMNIAKEVSRRSSCSRKHVGAALILDNRIISIGYNGVLPGRPKSEGLDSDGVSHTVHAEANIIAFCARNGIATLDSILYVTLSPCDKCAELIKQAGIKKVVFSELYRDTRGIEILTENNVECHQYTKSYHANEN